MSGTSPVSVETYVNPRAVRLTSATGFGVETRRPMNMHRTMPGYRPTPLHDCPTLARRLNVGSVLVKDESVRLGLPSFKILGASWAVLRAIATSWLDLADAEPSVGSLRARLDADRRPRALVAATDGNHGRGVARMADLLGLGCTILVPSGTADARTEAIASEGAKVLVVDGTYDDAITASAKLADEDTLVISDTSWEGYEDTPRAVIDGYSTMFFEIDDEIAARGWRQPTVLVVQAGVGAFAAAAERHYRTGPDATVRTVVVEPLSANCLMASARAGAIAEVPGPHPSRMAGLNCGLPSQLAWPIISAATDMFVAIDDDLAYEAMRTFAQLGIEAGESGAAALGGLLGLMRDERAARDAGLRPDSSVLIVNTEGATDPANYAAVVGDYRVASGTRP